jgi:hypothetical protein
VPGVLPVDMRDRLRATAPRRHSLAASLDTRLKQTTTQNAEADSSAGAELCVEQQRYVAIGRREREMAIARSPARPCRLAHTIIATSSGEIR